MYVLVVCVSRCVDVCVSRCVDVCLSFVDVCELLCRCVC